MPSGPMKLNGPDAALLAAACSLRAVPAGRAAVQEIVVQPGEFPTAGLASLIDDTKSPEAANPLFMYVWKPRSLDDPAGTPHVPPLLVDVTRRPPA